jgi:hypothetical protein
MLAGMRQVHRVHAATSPTCLYHGHTNHDAAGALIACAQLQVFLHTEALLVILTLYLFYKNVSQYNQFLFRRTFFRIPGSFTVFFFEVMNLMEK